ncbi:toxin [Enterobacterales bacterium CwR94]|nr:toxin [Enterobacterales bacterium CwR94]
MKLKSVLNPISAALLAAALCAPAVAAQPEISAYFLSGPAATAGTQPWYASLDNLEQMSQSIANKKAPFNSLVLSFVQPSLVKYEPFSLANTGLFGYVYDANAKSESSVNIEQAQADFGRLKAIIGQLKGNGIDVYIAVGGWNFSCQPEIYDATAGKVDACGNEEGAVYDTFPNPMTSSQIPRAAFESKIIGAEADKAYRALVSLAKDLGATGIDVDYEEFWHADINAKQWKLTPDTIGSAPGSNFEKLTTAQLMDKGGIANGRGDNVYDDNMKIVAGADKIPRAMPFTVDKFNAILKSIYKAADEIAPELKISTAAPAVGALPNMSANYGTVATNADVYGGAWWGGNLYGLVYNTALLYPESIDRLNHIGVMSYDLDETDCGSDSEIPCDLPGQVGFYLGQYQNWLKAANATASHHTLVKGAKNWAAASIQPQRLLIKPPITVGFEVGKPATGNLPLTHADLNAIVDQTVKYSPTGIIMWDLFKDLRHDGGNWQSDWATPNDVLTTVCEKMGLQGEHYDCTSEVPETK